ncbi:hypothetical protein SLA2020_381890 [Shorea laevis]
MAGRAISRKSFCCFCGLKYALFLIFCSLFFRFSTATDTITPNQNVTDGKTLLSAQNVFELGFFSPDGSPNKPYLGIWYYGIQPRTVVWVANREKPVLDYPGVFAMRNNGELQVMDGKGIILWSSADSTAKSFKGLPAKAKLMDDGNLVLQGGDIQWESFLQESNTFLPGMNMENKILRAWKSNSDPAPGDFTFRVNKGWNQFMIHNVSDLYWESGWSKNSMNFSEVPFILPSFIFPVKNFTHFLKMNFPETDLRTILNDLKTATLVINPAGKIVFQRWEKVWGWVPIWKAPDPEDKCGSYQVCGDYGICDNDRKESKCKCLKGFVPNSTEQWESGNYSGGCRRKAPSCSKNDYFVNISVAKIWYPDDPFPAKSDVECQNECKRKCCNAYFFEAVSGRLGELPTCWAWSSTAILKDLKIKNNDEEGGNLWVRVQGNTDTSGLPSNITQ